MFPMLSTFWSFLRPVFWLFVSNHECNKFPFFFFFCLQKLDLVNIICHERALQTRTVGSSVKPRNSEAQTGSLLASICNLQNIFVTLSHSNLAREDEVRGTGGRNFDPYLAYEDTELKRVVAALDSQCVLLSTILLYKTNAHNRTKQPQ